MVWRVDTCARVRVLEPHTTDVAIALKNLEWDASRLQVHRSTNTGDTSADNDGVESLGHIDGCGAHRLFAKL